MTTQPSPRSFANRRSLWLLLAVLVAGALILFSRGSAPRSNSPVVALASPTASLVSPATRAPDLASPSADPSLFIPDDSDPESLPPVETIAPDPTPAPAVADNLRWACAGDGWGESAAPVFCLPLPPCYFKAACQLEDQAWYQPSKIPVKLLREACTDIARAHDKSVTRCLADIRSWDDKQAWGVDDYIYADPDAPLYSPGG